MLQGHKKYYQVLCKLIENVVTTAGKITNHLFVLRSLTKNSVMIFTQSICLMKNYKNEH